MPLAAITYDRYAVPLYRYAHIIGVSENSFFGLADAPDAVRYSCRNIWAKWERDNVEQYLREAQTDIEDILGFPASPAWITDECKRYHCTVISEYGKVIEAGIREKTLITAATAVHTNDPATITIATPAWVLDDTYLEQIRVFYAEDEDLEVFPTSVVISGANIVITVPRARMVKYELMDNPEAGLLYTDILNFQVNVDVYRIRTITSTQGFLVWITKNCANPPCVESMSSACMQIIDGEIGVIGLRRATYSELTAAWSSSLSGGCCDGAPNYAILNYYAGMDKLPPATESIVVRLAHSKMPVEPCGCQVAQNLWKRDRNVPDILTRERLECPFGLNDGAWTAWRFAHRMALIRLGRI